MSPKSWIAADDTLHVMAGLVPAIPMLRGAVLQAIGITGTSPVMTSEVEVTSESPRAGDDRTGTVMTRWGITLSWVTHFFVPHPPSSHPPRHGRA
ncbi:hypothetical protein J4G37_08690 [Microvirga sp. 3-52]|nr:hypothetical protein [Microvirga sp. 3-52]